METEKELRIRELLANGTPLHVVRYEPLTTEERKELQMSGYQQMALYVFMGACIIGVPFLASEEELSRPYKYLISSVLLLGYGGLLLAVHKKMQAAYAKPKEVITGFITAKERERMKKGYAHYITVGKDQLVKVDTGAYHRYAIGDAVECHTFTEWGVVVFSHKLVDAELPK